MESENGIKEYETVMQQHLFNSKVNGAEPSIVGIGENLNLGCGFQKLRGFINVDMFDNCDPDVIWDLNQFPWPWEDNSIDYIFASHILEHLDNWWGAMVEASRILKSKGTLHIRVPDESESSAGTYRDHKHILSVFSFYGLMDGTGSIFRWERNVNAWAKEHYGEIPLKIVSYAQVPHTQYQWMVRWCPWLMRFCSDHMRNFIHEQRMEFEKVPDNIFKGKG